MFFNNLNNEISKVKSDGEYYARLIANQNTVIKKLEKKLTDRKDLAKDILDQAGEAIDSIKKERLEYYNKYNQNLFEYTEALKQLNSAENIYGREIGMLNDTVNNARIKVNELRNQIKRLDDTEQESLEIMSKLDNKVNRLKDKTTL